MITLKFNFPLLLKALIQKSHLLPGESSIMFNLSNLFRSIPSPKAQNTTDHPLTRMPKSKYLNLEGEAIVEQTIQPGKPGRVRFRGSWWPACCKQEIILVPGEMVYVVGRCNITLLVEQMHSTAPCS